MKKLLIYSLLVLSACSLFGAEKKFSAFKISLPSTESKTNFIAINATVVTETPSNAKELEQLAQKAISASPADLSNLLKSAKDVRRVMAFKKLARPDASKILATSKLGKYYVVFPSGGLPPQMAGKRPNINFMVFEDVNGKLLWNPSFNDPILQLMADSAKSVTEIDISSVKTSTEAEQKSLQNLVEKSLPFLNFENGALLSCATDKNVDAHSIAKFYRHAQNIFYSWKIDEYCNYLNPKAKTAFQNQFGSMEESEKKKILGEYFSWGKKYQKIAEAGNVNLIFFERFKDGNPSKNDFAYILNDDGKYTIAVLSDSKTPLELFIGKYIRTTPEEYLSAIENRFLK